MSRRFLAFLVFVTGMCITAIEITASRALAPFFGTSLFVWANVIGVVLIGLAIGYAVGGRLADRRPQLSVLLGIIFVAGIWTACIPLLVHLLTANLAQALAGAGFSFSLIIASFIASVLFFFPPVFLLAMASPFAVRLAAPDLQSSGKVVGRLYAVSTIGSIIGIFLPSFILIPFLGVQETFLLASLLLILLAALGVVGRRRWMLVGVLLPLAVYGATSSTAAPLWFNGTVLAEEDSAYQHLRVMHEEGDTVLRINDGIGFQSVYNPKAVLTGSYFDYYALLPFLLAEQKETLKVLLIGLAGGTISRQYDLLVNPVRPVAIDGVEIDAKVVSLARMYFDLDRPILTVHVDDGRHFLASSDKKYDVIIVDAYSQQIYIPPHMATKEFFALTKDRLNTGGIVAININAFRDDAALLRRMASTMRSVYSEVREQRLPSLVNVLLVASERPLSFDSLPERVPTELVNAAIATRHASTVQLASKESDIFTDNKAPIELLTERMFFDLLPQLE